MKKEIQMTKEEKIEALEAEMNEHYNKAWAARDEIEKLKLSDINFEGKFVARSSGCGAPFNDFMIVSSQQLTEIRGKKEVCLTGLAFYMMDGGYTDSIELFFRGEHTWWIPLSDILDLETNKKLKEIDKETYLKAVGEYMKSIPSFMDKWINVYIKNYVENDGENSSSTEGEASSL